MVRALLPRECAESGGSRVEVRLVRKTVRHGLKGEDRRMGGLVGQVGQVGWGDRCAKGKGI